ncbi:TPA: hypothetical protein ACPP6Z_000258 [Haemophilus influenzae]|uniref:hypothetical protein n=1 Tax=Haemophilus influenzae TaxID=727 RepID=UPI000D8A0A8D|nr:hypothetical protein [Haemophilus influenzae]BBF05616.1 hypothetical protein CHBNIII6_13010 [Haemophilus influenzae]GBK73680.1 hypothetical protein NTHiID1_10710 [Haemophilus influenzae]
MKNGAVAESGAQAGEYPNVDISKQFASTETQRHVKPLRMIDEVCFEMADKRGTQQWKN